MVDQDKKIEDKIMVEIKSGRLKLRSKYIFLAEKLGLGSAFVLSLILAVLFFNLVLFYLKASDDLGYLSFGSRGWLAFLESFPYLLVTSLVILIVIAGLIIRKTGMAYKRPFGYWAMGLVVFVLLAGTVLAFTNIAERIEARAYGRHPAGFLMRPFLERGFAGRHRGLAGRVIKVTEDYLGVQTPEQVERISLKHLEMPLREPVEDGMFVMAVGEQKDGIFEAKMIRVVEEGEMPMVGRGVHRRFGPLPLPPPRHF